MSESPARFSSIGAAVRSRIPVDAQGNFPVNRTLIAVLGFALALFNQALFWLLAVLIEVRGKPVTAGRFLAASLCLGAVLWLILAGLQARLVGGGRRQDLLAAGLTAGLLAAGIAGNSPGCAFAATVLFTAWGARGLKRQDGG